MAYYNKEPKYTHGNEPKVGIILANLGTPENQPQERCENIYNNF